MKSWAILGAAVGALCVATASSASAGTITYTDQRVLAQADDASGSGVTTSLTTGSSGVATATDGLAKATTTWDFATTSATYRFDAVTAGAYGSLSRALGDVVFTVDANTTYSISGSYSFSDRDDSNTAGERPYLYGHLYDFTTSQYLFANEQSDMSLDGGTFYLGGTEGSSVLIGSLNGSLLAGHSYLWTVHAYVHNSPIDGSYPTFYGSGSATLTIGTVVPLPPSALMGLSLLGGLGLLKLLRSRRQAAFV